NEQGVAIEPPVGKGFQQADAIAVEPIKQGMAEAADIRQDEQPSFMHRQAFFGPFSPLGLPAVKP
ncbi:MAG: hypothetical protein RLZZ604_1393, partial [Pseudomonadota bacterium]